MGNLLKAANVKLEISGRREKQRAVIKLNGQEKKLTNKSFEALIQLPVAMKLDGAGWVPGTKFGVVVAP